MIKHKGKNIEFESANNTHKYSPAPRLNYQAVNAHITNTD